MSPKPPENQRPPNPPAEPPQEPGTKKPETTPAQERGERLDTAKTIARSGKTEGHVPGAEPDK